MLRRAWKPAAAATLLIGTPSYIYYKYKTKPQTFDVSVKVRGPDGKSVVNKRTFPLQSMDDIDARIREHATSHTVPRPDGLIWKHTTASLAANDPIEDANSNAIIERDNTDPSAPGDLLFFAVMDGHSGPHTSRLLSKVLINAVALELSKLITDPDSMTPQSSEIIKSIKSLIRPSSTSSALYAKPEYVSLAIQNAFTKLDNELLQAPVHLLRANFDENARKNNIIPDLSGHPMASTVAQPPVSGSCALMAVLDTAHQNVYVACTGDSRAVAGVWEESSEGKGTWRVEVLSEDQTGRNPNERSRMQSEHPADEAESVIRNGRVLGGLEPSRAFGDARYKWPRDVQEVLSQAFFSGKLRPPPASFKTPPYVTARPVVTYRNLSFLPLADPSASKPSSTLRFIVMATDGLWDELTSEEVVSLVAGHLSGLKGNISKDKLSTLAPTSTGSPTVEGKDKKRSNKDSWAFVDDNISAHLIRNAFGGGNKTRLRQRLSIPAPFARSYRDDTTVTVIWWEDGREREAKVSQVTPDLATRAKL